MSSMKTELKKTNFIITTVVFIFFLLFWIYNNTMAASESMSFDYFSDSYGLVALIGSIIGFSVSKKWGGFQSVMGKAVSFFSLGLLFQSLGQFTYSYYYLVLLADVPYPSLGDFFYFGSIPLYIFAISNLAKASGVKLSMKAFGNKLMSVILPVVMLIASYLFFLRGYELDFEFPLVIFLDFGYPFGQAIYVSLAILTYLLCNKVLGGMMRNKVLFILVALVVQYFADYTFLYQNNRDMWTPSGSNELIYLVAYYLMAIGLIRLENVFKKSNKKLA